MHLGAAQGLVIGYLSGGHLDERRPRQKNLRLLLDHNIVVRQAGLVGAPRRRRTEDHADRGNFKLGKLDHLVEETTALGEMIHLGRSTLLFILVPITAAASPQIRPRRLDKAHVGNSVVPGDFQGAHPLLGHIRGERTPEHRWVVCEDHALHSGDHPDAEHRAAPNHIVRVVPGQRTDLEKGAIGVEHPIDPLANRQFSALGQALVVGRATPGLGLVEEFVDN